MLALLQQAVSVQMVLLLMVLVVVVAAVLSLHQKLCKELRERRMQQHYRLVKRLNAGNKLCSY
jgi:hypothetical protein